LRNIK